MFTLGSRINSIRKENKLTQNEFGQLLGISQTHVSKIEKDVENPSETLILFIAYKFVVDINWLKTGKGKKLPMTGSSRIETINEYNANRKKFEDFFNNYTSNELWSSIESYSFFVIMMSCLEIDRKLRPDYLKKITNLMRNMAITLNKIKEVCVDKENSCDEHKELKGLLERNADWVTESFAEIVNFLLENHDINIKI